MSTKKVYDTHTEWCNAEGKLHRENGPAIVRIDGSKEWYHNHLRHRIDGPAIEWENGDEEWFLNGLRHRVDGPAVKWFAYKRWYINGKRYTEEEHALLTWDRLTQEQQDDIIFG